MRENNQEKSFYPTLSTEVPPKVLKTSLKLNVFFFWTYFLDLFRILYLLSIIYKIRLCPL